jgi:hypothetical protein
MKKIKTLGGYEERNCPMSRFAIVLMLLILLLPIGVRAGDKPAEKPAGKISGYMFGDWYWVAANHDSTLKNQNGLWFRRIYVTYDKGLSEEFAVRFRFETSNSGDFKAGGRLDPFFKDAYLKWTRNRHSIIFGLSSSPTWERVESIWGYRSVEKTPLDLQKGWGGSRDFGIAFQGSLDPNKKLLYHFMIGNGSDTKSETDKDKKIYLSLAVKPVKELTVEAYWDWENRQDDKDVLTLQGFASYEQKKGRVGVQFAQQTRQQGPGKDDLKLEIFSVFGAGQLSEKAWAFGRIDRMFDPSPKGIAYIPFAEAKSTLIIAGVDLKPIPEVHLMPNVEVVVYSENEVTKIKPDADAIPRLTVYYTF